jgi:hypothetical protein
VFLFIGTKYINQTIPKSITLFENFFAGLEVAKSEASTSRESEPKLKGFSAAGHISSNYLFICLFSTFETGHICSNYFYVFFFDNGNSSHLFKLFFICLFFDI